MEIVKDFFEKSNNNNNGKPWKSITILRVKTKTLDILRDFAFVFFCILNTASFFVNFFIFSSFFNFSFSTCFFIFLLFFFSMCFFIFPRSSSFFIFFFALKWRTVLVARHRHNLPD